MLRAWPRTWLHARVDERFELRRDAYHRDAAVGPFERLGFGVAQAHPSLLFIAVAAFWHIKRGLLAGNVVEKCPERVYVLRFSVWLFAVLLRRLASSSSSSSSSLAAAAAAAGKASAETESDVCARV